MIQEEEVQQTLSKVQKLPSARLQHEVKLKLDERASEKMLLCGIEDFFPQNEAAQSMAYNYRLASLEGSRRISN
jgi:hypothetical protein